MKNLVVVTIICMLLILGGIVLTVVGILNTTQMEVTEDFHSEILPLNPDIAVYMPPTYELKLYASYPVLYIHGGQELMADWDADNEEGMLKDTLDRLIKDDSMEEVVVVTVYEDEDGISELASEFEAEGTEHAQNGEYAQFVEEELQPYIEKEYRILDHPKHLVFAELEDEGSLDKRLERFLLESYPKDS